MFGTFASLVPGQGVVRATQAPPVVAIHSLAKGCFMSLGAIGGFLLMHSFYGE